MPKNNVSNPIDDILDRLTSFFPKGQMDLGLERTHGILETLGSPHLKLPPVIHIAGTNGKGSTLAFIRAILESAGNKVHVMTSPHLVKLNERFVVASQEISDDVLLETLSELEEKNKGRPVSHFEALTIAGFIAFARYKADFCLLETGMGGRLDATNVVPDPVLTIITNISNDHMLHLGDTLAKVAFEKAGIMKRNMPCIIGPQTEEALAQGVMSVFETRARELSAPLYRHGHEWFFEETANGFVLKFLDGVFELPRPNLLGTHQIANAATAVVSALATPQLSLLRKETSSFDAITRARWPARLQQIESGPLFDIMPKGWELFLDGGHNEAGGKILADQARAWAAQDGKTLHLILGMLTTKDPQPFYDHLKPHIASATAIPIPDERLAFGAEELARTLNIVSGTNPQAAILHATQGQSTGRILITGSLYLSGYILKTSFMSKCNA